MINTDNTREMPNTRKMHQL